MIVAVYKEQEVHFRHLDKGGGGGGGRCHGCEHRSPMGRKGLPGKNNLADKM